MSHSIYSTPVDDIKVKFDNVLDWTSDAPETVSVAQKAITPQLAEGVKPGLPPGRFIPLEVLTDSSPPTGDDDSEYHSARNSSETSIAGARGDDDIEAFSVEASEDWVMVGHDEVSASPDMPISTNSKPGIISKTFSRIFKRSDEQIVQSTVKEINEKYKQFTKALKPGQSFKNIQKSLNNREFIGQIMELKDLSGSFEGEMGEEIQSGLKLFKQMMKASEFIDVATQRNSSIKLNTTQIQVVKTILEGRSDPLYQTPELGELGEGTYGKVDETSPGEGLDNYAIKCCKILNKDDYIVGAREQIREYNEKTLDGLQKEYKILMKFDHPNIVQPIYAHNRVFYMELAKGGDLCTRCRTMSGEQLIKTLIQTADALDHVHQKGYVHGDVKPDNIFLTEGGDVKVGDFGLCRHQDNFQFEFVGEYAAYHYPPEFLSGDINTMDGALKKEALSKCDSWSFGAMLWLMLNTSDRGSIYHRDRSVCSSIELTNMLRHSLEIGKFSREGLDIGRIMCACLNPNFRERPTMAQVRDMLKKRGRF